MTNVSYINTLPGLLHGPCENYFNSDTGSYPHTRPIEDEFCLETIAVAAMFSNYNLPSSQKNFFQHTHTHTHTDMTLMRS